MMTHEMKFRVHPEAAASQHENGIVILHLGKGSLFASNETGARIWRGLERQLPVDSIADEISNEYRIDRGAARQHTMLFLAALERHALVERGGVA